MIKEKTVFVLGAGASKPYGFPTGRDLKNVVLKNMTWGRGPWKGYLSELEFVQNEVEAFVREFRESPQPSVDLFVEHRLEYARLGKAAIAFALIPCERPQNVFPSESDDNWYEYIFGKMAAPFDRFIKNRVAFVTFNYDRSLEHFFRTSLKNSYGKTFAEADAVLNNIPIVHVHGQLGTLHEEDGRPFKPDLSTQGIQVAMKDTVIMGDASHDSAEFKKARRLLAAAEHIYFLGLGYHESNMERLQVPDYHGKIGGGTSLGLGLAEREDIQGQWKVPMFTAKPWAQDLNTLGFLKNAVSLR